MIRFDNLTLRFANKAGRGEFLNAVEKFADETTQEAGVETGFIVDCLDDPKVVEFYGMTDGETLEKFLLPYVKAGLFEPTIALAANDEGVDVYYLEITPSHQLITRKPMPGPAKEEWKVEDRLCYYNDDRRPIEDILAAGVTRTFTEKLLALGISAVEIRNGELLFEIFDLTIEKTIEAARLFPTVEWRSDCFAVKIESEIPICHMDAS